LLPPVAGVSPACTCMQGQTTERSWTCSTWRCACTTLRQHPLIGILGGRLRGDMITGVSLFPTDESNAESGSSSRQQSAAAADALPINPNACAMLGTRFDHTSGLPLAISPRLGWQPSSRARLLLPRRSRPRHRSTINAEVAPGRRLTLNPLAPWRCTERPLPACPSGSWCWRLLLNRLKV
jgi:hypothetical protein